LVLPPLELTPPAPTFISFIVLPPNTAVAVAPVPLPPVNDISGAEVYPEPLFVTEIEVIAPPEIVAVAVAAIVGIFPVTGVITTVGADTYPVPPEIIDICDTFR